MKFKQRTLSQVVADLKKLPYIEAIILFGSQARGTARQDSDFDIAVITRETTKEQELEIYGNSDDVHEINQLTRLPLIIQFRVFAEGKALYVKEECVLEKIRADILRKYLAEESYLEHTARRVLANV